MKKNNYRSLLNYMAIAFIGLFVFLIILMIIKQNKENDNDNILYVNATESISTEVTSTPSPEPSPTTDISSDTVEITEGPLCDAIRAISENVVIKNSKSNTCNYYMWIYPTSKAPTDQAMEYIETAFNIKTKCAEILKENNCEKFTCSFIPDPDKSAMYTFDFLLENGEYEYKESPFADLLVMTMDEEYKNAMTTALQYALDTYY